MFSTVRAPKDKMQNKVCGNLLKYANMVVDIFAVSSCTRQDRHGHWHINKNTSNARCRLTAWNDRLTILNVHAFIMTIFMQECTRACANDSLDPND